MSFRSLAVLLALATALSACQAVYDSSRGSAERRCESQVSRTQYEECRAGARALPTYNEYEKQRQGAGTGSNEQAAARKDAQTKRDEGLCFTRQATGERVCPN